MTTVRSTVCPVWFDTTTDPVMASFEALGGCFQSRVRAEGMWMTKGLMSLADGPPESVKATEKLKSPGAVGTPEINPSFGSSCRPGGSGPEPSANRHV